ncbi:hypothetical protein D3C81_1656550 [compost metagenome]
MAQQPPLGRTTHAILARQVGAQPGTEPVLGQLSELVIQGAEIANPLLVLNAHERTDHLFVVHSGVQPPAGVVHLEDTADFS